MVVEKPANGAVGVFEVINSVMDLMDGVKTMQVDSICSDGASENTTMFEDLLRTHGTEHTNDQEILWKGKRLVLLRDWVSDCGARV